MFGVVAGHVASNYKLSFPPLLIVLVIFGRGLMPMFFMISGLGFRKTRMRKCLNKNVKELLIPYFWTTVAVVICFPLIHYLAFRWLPGTIQETSRIILAFLTGCSRSGKTVFGLSLYECTPMWYILSLFWSVILVNLLSKEDKKWVRILGLLACVVIGWQLAVTDIFWYWCIPQGLMATGYFYVGYIIKEKKWLERRHSAWQYGLIVSGAVAELVLGNFSMAYAVFAWGLLDYIGAGCVGALLLRLGFWVDRYEGKISDGIRRVGRYSYWIMCIHAVETNCIPWYLLAEKFETHPHVGFFLELLLRALLLGGCCVILDRISRYRRRKKEKNQYVSKRLSKEHIKAISERLPG